MSTHQQKPRFLPLEGRHCGRSRGGRREPHPEAPARGPDAWGGGPAPVCVCGGGVVSLGVSGSLPGRGRGLGAAWGQEGAGLRRLPTGEGAGPAPAHLLLLVEALAVAVGDVRAPGAQRVQELQTAQHVLHLPAAGPLGGAGWRRAGHSGAPPPHKVPPARCPSSICCRTQLSPPQEGANHGAISRVSPDKAWSRGQRPPRPGGQKEAHLCECLSSAWRPAADHTGPPAVFDLGPVRSPPPRPRKGTVRSLSCGGGGAMAAASPIRWAPAGP